MPAANARSRARPSRDRKSTRLNSSHLGISYAVFCLKKKNTHQKISFGGAVTKGIKYLQGIKDEEGCFGGSTGEFMYNHAISSVAMADADEFISSGQYRPISQKRIHCLSLSHNPYRAWRYTVKPGDNDTSFTWWCVMALKSADISRLQTAHTGYDGAKAWIDQV